jgi:hypothetical protein
VGAPARNVTPARTSRRHIEFRPPPTDGIGEDLRMPRRRAMLLLRTNYGISCRWSHREEVGASPKRAMSHRRLDLAAADISNSATTRRDRPAYGYHAEKGRAAESGMAQL